MSHAGLPEWLRAQLDADEQIAREATPGPWQNAPTARHHATASGRSEEAVFASPPDAGATIVAATGEAAERRHLVDAEHIVRHDPSRVLREIDAKRQLLELHHSIELPTEALDACAECEVTGAYPEYPCRTLRLLALPYADRPGYREEWRP
ncbi:DUF6221 family protein [Streptomyces sp. NPDC056817]|uniref:DUF6221 family protein n=1 Tax=Streptomyces sp. NPDC056817 TaxID=3345950 RepID=UPI0036CF69BB